MACRTVKLGFFLHFGKPGKPSKPGKPNKPSNLGKLGKPGKPGKMQKNGIVYHKSRFTRFTNFTRFTQLKKYLFGLTSSLIWNILLLKILENLWHQNKYFIGGKGLCGCLNLATNCLKFEAATFSRQT